MSAITQLLYSYKGCDANDLDLIQWFTLCFSPKTSEKIQQIYTQAMSRDTGISQKLDIRLSYFGRKLLSECMSNL